MGSAYRDLWGSGVTLPKSWPAGCGASHAGLGVVPVRPPGPSARRIGAFRVGDELAVLSVADVSFNERIASLIVVPSVTFFDFPFDLGWT